MKSVLFFITAVFFIGCQERVTVTNPMPHNSIQSEITYYSVHSNSDSELRFLFYVIANEGKKNGAKYFSLSYSVGKYNYPTSAYLGSPLTNISEVLAYCEKDVFGGNRKRCPQYSGDSTLEGVRYFIENNEADVLLWNIEETLNDPQIQRAADEYTMKVYIPKK